MKAEICSVLQTNVPARASGHGAVGFAHRVPLQPASSTQHLSSSRAIGFAGTVILWLDWGMSLRIPY